MDVYLRDAPRTLVLVRRQGDDDDDRSTPSTSISRATAAAASSAPTAYRPRVVGGTSDAGVLGKTTYVTSSSPSAPLLLVSTAENAEGRSTAAPRATLQMASSGDVELDQLTKLNAAPLIGCLGLMNVGRDLFVVVVTSASEVGEIRRGDAVSRVTSVAFYCVNRDTWDRLHLAEQGLVGGGLGLDEPGPLDPQGYQLPLGGEPPAYSGATSAAALPEHPCASLRKLLGAGSFYFARDDSFDLSSRLQRRASSRPSPTTSMTTVLRDVAEFDERFVWNHYMAKPMLEFRGALEAEERARLDAAHFLVLVIQGFVGVHHFAGGARSAVAPSPSSESTVALVSRLSRKRAGTRFNARGIDDDGNVANFVESETILQHEGVTFSYVQVRGSVPLFWEQQGGLQALNARVQITRPRVASQPSFDRHFAELLATYGALHCLNLLGTRDAETALSSAYAEHMRHSEAVELARSARGVSDGIAVNRGGLGVGGEKRAGTLGSRDGPATPAPGDDEKAAMATSLADGTLDEDPVDPLGLTNLDFHATARLSGLGIDGVRSELRRLAPVQRKVQAFGFCAVLISGDKQGAEEGNMDLFRSQRGVFRTNCLDCLDRTNVVQDMLSQTTLEAILDMALRSSPNDSAFAPLRSPSHALWSHHRVLWAENGDALSRLYTGTGALNTSYTRTGGGKRTLGGLLSDAAKSAGRLYASNFQDRGKQNVIDSLLGNLANQSAVSVYDPVNDSVQAQLIERLDEYSESRPIRLFAATWNLGGRPPSGESLLPLLCPEGLEEPDIYAFGLQEVVPLTPSQILLTDPEKLRMWEGIVVETLAQRQKRRGGGRASKGAPAAADDEFVLLRSEQLVGTALMVLVRARLVRHVRSVEAATRKTGLKGMSGNKGGIAIRLVVHDTSLCLVTAHMAAGARNVDERNADYATISGGLAFMRGRTIASHDHVVWLGDFNYRIDLANDVVRAKARDGDLASLAMHDQLLRSREMGLAFGGYDEGPLNFAPTYKYDLHSSVYDTSEKMRTPAWTDRVLYRGGHGGSGDGGSARRTLSVRLERYDRAELRSSDHRPVFASLIVETRAFDHEKRLALRRQLLSSAKSSQAQAAMPGGRRVAPLPPSTSTTPLASAPSSAAASASASAAESDSSDMEDFPQPSSDSNRWWDDSAQSPSSSDDELAIGLESAIVDAPNGSMDVNPFLTRKATAASRPASHLRATKNKAQASPLPPATPRRPSPVTMRNGDASRPRASLSRPAPKALGDATVSSGSPRAVSDSAAARAAPRSVADASAAIKPKAGVRGSAGSAAAAPTAVPSGQGADVAVLVEIDGEEGTTEKGGVGTPARNGSTKPPPPPRPPKPAGAAVKSAGSTATTRPTPPSDVVPGGAPTPPIPPPVPARRPMLGTRTASYASSSGQRSFIEAVDDDG